MGSPDVSPYVDPTIYDQQPADIYDASVAYARASLPEWTPTVGSIEDALLQAASGVSGELLGALNRTTSSITEAVLQMFQIERLTGTKPTAVLQLALSDDVGHTLKKGTRFGWFDSGGSDPVLYVFESTVDVVAARLSTSMSVPVQGILNEEYPMLAAGAFIRVLSAVPWIDTAILEEDLDVGTNPETDVEYFARAIGLLGSYSQALVLPKQFEQYLLAKYVDVFRVKAYSRLAVVDQYDGVPRNDLVAETRPTNGYLTIYACGLNGASLSVEKSKAMAADLMGRGVAGLQIDIVPPHIVPIDVNATIICSAGYSATVVTASVNTALLKYLTPNYWSWGDTIFYNEVITAINNVVGVARVEDLSIVVSMPNHVVGIPLEDVVAFTGKGVVNGCVVSDGASGMSVSVAAGTVQPSFAIGYVNVAPASRTFTAANATNPRIDIIEVNTSGVIAVKTGVAAIVPVEPEPTTNSIKLAAVSIPAGTTNILPAMISDRRAFVNAYTDPGGAWPVGSLDVSGADLAFTRYGSLPDATVSVTARALG